MCVCVRVVDLLHALLGLRRRRLRHFLHLFCAHNSAKIPRSDSEQHVQNVTIVINIVVAVAIVDVARCAVCSLLVGDDMCV